MGISKIVRITIEYEDRYESLYDEEAEEFYHQAETLISHRPWNIWTKHIKCCLHPHRTLSGRDCFICCKCRRLADSLPKNQTQETHDGKEENT